MSVYFPRWHANILSLETALARCDTQAELEDAWFAGCDHFPDNSRERRHLLNIYNAKLGSIREADVKRAGFLKLARAL